LTPAVTSFSLHPASDNASTAAQQAERMFLNVSFTDFSPVQAAEIIVPARHCVQSLPRGDAGRGRRTEQLHELKISGRTGSLAMYPNLIGGNGQSVFNRLLFAGWP
jgi:hypothetical protein